VLAEITTDDALTRAEAPRVVPARCSCRERDAGVAAGRIPAVESQSAFVFIWIEKPAGAAEGPVPQTWTVMLDGVLLRQ
jgi:hypothetical protein